MLITKLFDPFYLLKFVCFRTLKSDPSDSGKSRTTSFSNYLNSQSAKKKTAREIKRDAERKYQEEMGKQHKIKITKYDCCVDNFPHALDMVLIAF